MERSKSGRLVLLLMFVLSVVYLRNLSAAALLNAASYQTWRLLQQPDTRSSRNAEDLLQTARHLGSHRADRLLAKIYSVRGDYETAQPFYQRAVAMDPEDVLSRIGLLYALDKLGDSVGFVREYERLLRKWDNYDYIRYFYKENTYSNLPLASFDPRAPDYSADITVLNYLRAGKQWLALAERELARNAFLKALELRPETTYAVYQLSRIAASEGDDEKAKYYRGLVDSYAFTELLKSRDIRLDALDVEALSSLASDRIWPLDRAISYGQALVWCCANIPEVLVYAEVLRTRYPQNRDLKILSGRLARERGEWYRALKFYQDALNIDPLSIGTWREIGRWLDAMTSKTGNVENEPLLGVVESLLLQATQLFPDDVYFLDRLRSLYVLKHDTRAEQVRMRIVEILRHKQPEHVLRETVNPNWTLVGFSLIDEERTMIDGFGEMLVFWESNQMERNNLCSDCYHVNGYWIEIVSFRNLVPNAGFEWNPDRDNLPFGFPTRMYEGQNSPVQERVERGATGRGTTVLILDNSPLHMRSGLSSFDISIEPGAAYLLGGWVKAEATSRAFLGCQMLIDNQRESIYNYAAAGIYPEEWKYYVKLFAVPNNVHRCLLWLTNYNATGKASFDNILLTRVEAPSSGVGRQYPGTR